MEISINQLMEISGMSYRTIKKRLEGLSPERKEGRAYLYESTKVLPILFNWKPAKRDLVLNEERARLAKEQADAQELKNAQLRGQLIPAADVAEAWSKIVVAVKQHVLALPSRLAQMLETVETRAGKQAIMEAEVKKALEALADHGKKMV
ncbi:MAG: DUF1441 family protein [Deltaproteobacteria bacterium]|nr:DUF1441 family protein [Deltaproteobacteria bacterium]